MAEKTKSQIRFFRNFSINSKMISYTVIIIIFAGVIATYSLIQISSLTDRLHEIQDEDWVLANGYNKINIGVNAQSRDINAYVLGINNTRADFLNQNMLIQSSMSNITNIVGNSSSDFSSVQLKYSELSKISLNTSTGIFDLTDSFFNSVNQRNFDQGKLDSLSDKIELVIDALISETSVETGHNNATVMHQVQDLDSAILEGRNTVLSIMDDSNNSDVTNLKSEFLFIYDGYDNNESIVNEMTILDSSLQGAILDNSIGNSSIMYLNQLHTLIQTGNSTYKSWFTSITENSNGLIDRKTTENTLNTQTHDLLIQTSYTPNLFINLKFPNM